MNFIYVYYRCIMCIIVEWNSHVKTYSACVYAYKKEKEVYRNFSINF